jgi:hypothetical protein
LALWEPALCGLNSVEDALRGLRRVLSLLATAVRAGLLPPPPRVMGGVASGEWR